MSRLPVVPRRAVLAGLALAAAAVLLVPACRPAARPGTPPQHLLLITVDTLRADHLSAWLYPRPTSSTPTDPELRGTPRDDSIDGLAGTGVVFSNAFAPRGQTFPSIATLMTGLSPFEHGARDNRDTLPAETATLAQRLKARGFVTGGFTTNQLLAPGSGIERGFDHFSCEWRPADRDLAILGAASRWVTEQRAAGAQRIFTWVHLMGPHMPYEPLSLHGTDYARIFVDPGYEGEADGSRAFLDEAYASGKELSREDVARVVAAYDGEIARINALIGLFLLAYADRRDGRDHLEDTLLVFTADHGEELHQRHGYWGHSKSVYGSVLHVPLFFRHPRSLTGTRVFDDVVGLEDVFPTILEWFDVPLGERVAGRSLLSRMDGRAFAERPAFGHWRDRIFTVRTKRWRLVLNPDGVTPEEEPPGPYPVPKLALFDTAHDPLERHDVSARHPDVVRELTGAIDRWLAGLTHRTASGPLSAERRDALRALGYLGDDDDAARTVVDEEVGARDADR